MPSGDPEMIFFSPEVEQVVENDEVFFQESEKTLIDPSDWLLEVKRVEKKLVLQDSPDLSPNTLKKTFQVIKQFNHSENPVILSSKALKLTEDLEKIKSKEQLLQRMFKVETLKAKEVLEISKALRSPVRSFSTGSKVLEKFNFKRNHVESLKTQLEEIEKRMKIFEKTPHAVNPVPKMKESIVKLKKDLRQLELTTGILRTYHNSCLVPK
jgi:hypothetical protein